MLLTLLIIAFVGFSTYRGTRRGLTLEVVDVVGLVAAVVAAALLGPVLGAVLRVLTPLADGATAVGGRVVVFAAAMVGVAVTSRWARRHGGLLPARISLADTVGGSLFSATWSMLLVTGLLLLSVTVPGARARTADHICGSGVARTLVGDVNPLHTGGERIAEFSRPVLLWVSQRLFNVFTLAHGQQLCEQLAAGNDVRGAFRFPPADRADIDVDEDAEGAVLRLLNKARQEEGVAGVYIDPLLQEVARDHARDMYLRGYFAHETPECSAGGEGTPAGCRDPFDRMDAAGVDFDIAGENLALASTVSAAHQGLLGSPGHRRNMLDPDFERVGIGVVEGPYGLMVAQEFAG